MDTLCKVKVESVPRHLSLFVLCVLVMMSGCTTSMSAASLVRNQELERQQAASASTVVPDDRNLYLSLIQEMQSKGMYYASLAHVDAFEKKYGVQPDIELLRGDALRETRQQEAALGVYRSLLTTDVAARAQHGIGRTLAAEHKMSEATQALNAAVQLDPTNVDFLNDLGFAFMASGNMPDARVPIAQAAELAPSNKKVLANLMLYLLLTGQGGAADQVAAMAKLPDATLQATRSLAVQLSMQQSRSNVQDTAAKIAVTEVHAQNTVSPGVADAQLASGNALTSVVPTLGTAAEARPVTRTDVLAGANGVSAATPAALAWQGAPVLQRFGDAR